MPIRIKKLLFYYIYMIPTYIISRILGVNRNKVFFLNFNGTGFTDNPRAIAEELNKTDPRITIIWCVTQKENMPSWIIQTTKWSPTSLFHLLTAKVLVNNTRIDIKFPKSRKQCYIQTWHGCIPLKKIEKDVERALSKEWKECSQYDSKIADLFISNSRWCTSMYRRAFWYSGEILECGSPRCDYMIKNPQGDGRVHRFYGLNASIKLVIYAPTFRKDHGNPYDIDLKRLIRMLNKKDGTEYKLLVRLHPAVCKMQYFAFDDYILDGNLYLDIYELLSECEMLITDYSSTMFEMSYIHKPVLLYAPDIDEYMDDRGFYFKLDELPYPLATNNDELEEVITTFDNESYQKKVEDFLKPFNIREKGTASLEVVNLILKKLNK